MDNKTNSVVFLGASMPHITSLFLGPPPCPHMERDMDIEMDRFHEAYPMNLEQFDYLMSELEAASHNGPTIKAHLDNIATTLKQSYEAMRSRAKKASRARNEALTPNQRRKIAQNAARKRWGLTE